MYDYYDFYSSGGSVWTTILSLLLAAVGIVAMWRVFEKAGEPGWASLIPFYNTYVLFKITWGNGWKFLLLLIPLANIVFAIMTMVKLARSFGKGGGFAAGLIFLSPIFMLILAFGEAQYVGPGGVAYAAQSYNQPYQPYNAQTGYQPQQSGQTSYQPYSQPQNYTQPTYTPQEASPQQSYTPQQGYQPQYTQASYSQPEQPAQAAYCSSCGSKLEPGARFCPNCGAAQ